MLNKLLLSKSNKEFYQDNLQRGYLYSLVKDGEGGEQGIDLLINYSYPGALLIVIVITILLFLLCRKRWGWNQFLLYLFPISLAGWVWNIFIAKIDTSYPAWLYRPKGILGFEWMLTVEDWIFCPVIASLFYGVYRLLEPRVTDLKKGRSGWLLTSFMLFLMICLFFLVFGSMCGRSLAVLYGIPILVLWVMCWKWMNLRLFGVCMLFALLFEAFWDYGAVSGLPAVSGYSWASGWIYLSFDAWGKAYHSSVFLSYEKYPWAWIFNNPIEITPWYGMLSALPFLTIVFLDSRGKKPFRSHKLSQ